MITNKMYTFLSTYMRRSKKNLLIAFGVAAIFFNIFAPVTLAQTLQQGQWYTPTYGDFNIKVTADPQEEIFGERYTQAQVYWIIYSLVNFLTGSEVGQCVTEALTTDTLDVNALTTCLQSAGISVPSDQSYSPVNSPMLALAHLTDVTRTTMPASGIQYLSEKIDHIVPTAHAQTGFGFNTLSGTRNLWGASRNMTYGLMVLVVLVLAFGIMFRVKLNPQTSITIQSAIPKVVIALVVITFSYAIAGLLIDLAYLVQGIIASFIVASGISGLGPVEFLTTMNNSSYGILSIGLLTIVFGIAGGAALAIGGVIAGGVTLPVVGAIGGGTFGIIGGIIIFILLILAFVVSLIRILILFLKSYAVLLINIVFGPFIILMGAVNLGSGVAGWAKNIVAQLSVFVTASVLIVVAHIFVWGSGAFPVLAGCPNGIFNAFCINSGGASLGSASLPGFGGANESLLGFFVGFIVIFAIPNLASFVRDQISKPARLELGIGAAFGPSRWLMNQGMALRDAQRAPEAAREAARAKMLGEAAALGTPMSPAERGELIGASEKEALRNALSQIMGRRGR